MHRPGCISVIDLCCSYTAISLAAGRCAECPDVVEAPSHDPNPNPKCIQRHTYDKRDIVTITDKA